MEEKRITTWSFSRLDVFEKCPYQAKLKYIDKRPEPETVDRTALDRGIEIHQQAEDFVRGKVDALPAILFHFREDLEFHRDMLSSGERHVELEEDWGFTREWQPCDWMAEDVWLRMKLDRLYLPEETEAEVVDYKTGRKYPVKHSQQRVLYAIGTFMRFPDLEGVTVRFQYIDEKDETRKHYTREQALRFVPTWESRASKMLEATEFPAKPNKHNCRFCPYSPNRGGDSSCPWGVEV